MVSVEFDRQTKTTLLVTDEDIVGIKTGDDKTADCFFNLDMNNGSFVIRGNTFRNLRRFGVLIQGRDGIVENNRFEWTSSNAIMVRNSVNWPEGFPTGNLIIRGNTFENCGFDHTMQTSDAAGFSRSSADPDPTGKRAQRRSDRKSRARHAKHRTPRRYAGPLVRGSPHAIQRGSTIAGKTREFDLSFAVIFDILAPA